MKNRERGIGLVEILVVLVILSVAITGVSTILSMGFYFIKQAEHKTKAMDIAYYEMSKALSRSYESPLLKTELNKSVALSAEEDDGTDYSLSTIIDEGFIQQSTGLAMIPYKNITVECAYQDKKTGGKLSSLKKVRLTNMLPYPYIHTFSFATDPFPVNNPKGKAPLIPIGSTAADYKNIPFDLKGSAIEIPLNFKVYKDVIVNYNIAINPVLGTYQLPSYALVKTRCTIDNAPAGAIETGTPILSQLFICNQIVISRLTPNQNHVLRLQWYRESYANPAAIDDAAVYLRKFEVTIRAYETQ